MKKLFISFNFALIFLLGRNSNKITSTDFPKEISRTYTETTFIVARS
jgi:hypothetical protein